MAERDTVRACLGEGWRERASWISSSRVPRAHPGWAVLTSSSQTCQHRSRSRSICHCLMVSITILMRDLVLSITSALSCHHWSPSCGCEDTSGADFYITFTSGATAEFKPELSGIDHSFKGHFNIFNRFGFQCSRFLTMKIAGWKMCMLRTDPCLHIVLNCICYKCGPYWCFILIMTLVSTWILALMRGCDIAFLPALWSESQQEH